MKRVGAFFFIIAAMLVMGCSKSDNDQKVVNADPEGTVEMDLATYGFHGQYEINLADNVSISLEEDSLTVYRAVVTNIGKVESLSAIQYVPAVGPWKDGPGGWERIAVKPKHGYIIRSRDNQVYTRIFVEALNMGANDKDIIGAHIKFQSPWMDYK